MKDFGKWVRNQSQQQQHLTEAHKIETGYLSISEEVLETGRLAESRGRFPVTFDPPEPIARRKSKQEIREWLDSQEFLALYSRLGTFKDLKQAILDKCY